MTKTRLIIALFHDYLYVIGNKPTKDGLGRGNVMQKKKAAETQVQQELSSDLTSTRTSQAAWSQGREPMTGAQAASLRRLADEIREPHAFDAGLSKSEAARRIDRLQERVRLGELPPHTD